MMLELRQQKFYALLERCDLRWGLPEWEVPCRFAESFDEEQRSETLDGPRHVGSNRRSDKRFTRKGEHISIRGQKVTLSRRFVKPKPESLRPQLLLKGCLSYPVPLPWQVRTLGKLTRNRNKKIVLTRVYLAKPSFARTTTSHNVQSF